MQRGAYGQKIEKLPSDAVWDLLVLRIVLSVALIIAYSIGEEIPTHPCDVGYAIVVPLPYPCHRSGPDFVDASNRKHIDIQPTQRRTEHDPDAI
jgi:hypothetical protein